MKGNVRKKKEGTAADGTLYRKGVVETLKRPIETYSKDKEHVT